VEFAEAILALGQEDVICVAEDVLAMLLNGASALRYLRMFPGAATDSIHDVLRSTSVQPKGRGKQ